ncbi:helix-turn-helix domain-containing protein [Streptomyces sp. NPDC127039]|uniref:helix-turn-helix transcriptional regulator n=1 Tax=Streptomyces sp. NPDC127039 TaxID=3347115 RepID=UPI003660FE68
MTRSADPGPGPGQEAARPDPSGRAERHGQGGGGGQSGQRLHADDDFVAAEGHPTHVHDFHQLLYVPLGRIEVTACGTDHVLTPSVALWLPAGVPHSARFDPDSLVVSDGFDAERYALPHERPFVLHVDEARRRLLLARMRSGGRAPGDALVFAELTGAGEHRLPLPRPSGAAARAVAGALLRDPSDQRTAAQWAEGLYTSSTSLRRAFRTETGLAFSDWRTRARLNRSLELLTEGLQVGVVAKRVGFVSTNGFILAFRRHFDCTPGVYVRERTERVLSG